MEERKADDDCLVITADPWYKAPLPPNLAAIAEKKCLTEIQRENNSDSCPPPP